jgi:hypothetical protein
MTTWEHHHPPHDHPDFDAYLDTLTDDDLTAINAAINAAFHTGLNRPGSSGERTH